MLNPFHNPLDDEAGSGFPVANASTLMRQAPMTVSGTYLPAVVHDVDALFGEGFAKKNPEMVARLVQACAQDFLTSQIGVYLRELNETAREALTGREGHLADAVFDLAGALTAMGEKVAEALEPQ